MFSTPALLQPITLFILFGKITADFEFVAMSGVVTRLDGDRNVVLPCGVTVDPQLVQFQWTLQNYVVHDDGRRSQVGSNLHFSRLVRNLDTGEFRCVVTELETGLSRTSPPIRINFIWLSDKAEVRVVKPKGGEVVRGQEVILECEVEGSVEIKFKWHRNGEVETGSGKKLNLGGVGVESSGSYKCDASSDAGKVSSPFFHLLIPDDDDDVQDFLLPSSQVVPVNTPVTINCVLGQTPLEWIFQQNFVQNSSRWRLLTNGSLLITQLSSNEVGIYKCRSRTKNHFTFAAEIQIASIEPLTVDSLLPKPWPLTPDQLGFASGSKVEVFCSPPAGLPPPRVWWEGPFDVASVRDNHTLFFPKVSPDDVGRYTCRAENVAGASAVSFVLVITKPPKLTAQPQGQDVEEGETAVFRCPFSGSSWPLTRVTWTHNQGPLRHVHHASPNSRHHHRILNMEQNGTLSLEAAKLEDQGAYACQLATQGQPIVTSREALLRVRQRLKFVSHPVDRRLELGLNYKIPCKAQGDPPPTINWIKVGGVKFGWPKHITEDNGVLHFSPIDKSDEGEYMCLATSAQGIINITITITVSSSPRFVVIPKNPTEAIEGEPLRMDCGAEGDPLPTIKWDQDRDASSIINDRYLLFDNGSLYIRQVSLDDHGRRFGCTAGNSGGFKREEVELIVARNEDYMSPEQSGVMTRTVWITLSVAAGYMLLVVGLMLWCGYRQLKRKTAYLADIRAELVETELKDGLSVPTEMTPKTTNTRAGSVRSDDGETGRSTHSSLLGTGQTKSGSGPPSLVSHRSHASTQSKRSYEEISGERKDLQFVMLLGHGNYGEVFLAKGRVEETERLLMVKALQTKEGGALAEFRREIEIFSKVRHENVSALVRLCREMDPHYLIMEYSDWGDLKQFLLATRPDHPMTPKPPRLTPSQVLNVISEVALGMDHLASLRFVHKDLATRNCLIASGFRVQVANPSLCKDTYANEYSLFRNKLVPLRWLSPEALLEGDYSTKSDIWSFGCLLWEVSHQAALPWQQLAEPDLIGQWERREEPQWDFKGLPAPLVTLLKDACQLCPRNRPTFTQVVETLSKLIH